MIALLNLFLIIILHIFVYILEYTDFLWTREVILKNVLALLVFFLYFYSILLKLN